MKRLKSFFIDKESVHKTAYILAVLVFVSQITAYIRDKLLTYTLGAGSELDTYFASFFIPDLVFILFATLFSSSVLVPFYSKNKDRLRYYSGAFILLFITCCIPTIFFMWLGIPKLTALLYPKLNQNYLIEFSRILLLSPIILGLSGIITSTLSVSRRLIVFGFSPIVYNLGIVFGIVFLKPYFGTSGIIYGVILGAIFHLLVQLPSLISLKLKPHFVFTKEFIFQKELFMVLSQALPRSLALSVNQLFIFSLSILSGLLSPGIISSMMLAINLQSVPVSILGISFSQVIFTKASESAHNRDIKSLSLQFTQTMSHISLLALGSSVLLTLFSFEIVFILFGGGNFSFNSIQETSSMMSIFSLSIFASITMMILSKIFYAFSKSWDPLFSAIKSLFIISVFAVGTYYLGIFEISKNTIAFVYVTFLMIYMIDLGYKVWKLLSFSLSNLCLEIFKQSVACGISFLVVYMFRVYLYSDNYYSYIISQGKLHTIASVFIWALLSSLVIYVCLIVMKSKELKTIQNKIAKRNLF